MNRIDSTLAFLEPIPWGGVFGRGWQPGWGMISDIHGISKFPIAGWLVASVLDSKSGVFHELTHFVGFYPGEFVEHVPTSQLIATENVPHKKTYPLQGILEKGQFESCWISDIHVDVHLQESNRQELSTDIVLPHCREDLNLGVFFKQTWWGGWGRTPLGVFECFWWFKGTAELV